MLKCGNKMLIWCFLLTIWTLPNEVKSSSSDLIPEKYDLYAAYELKCMDEIPYLGVVHILVKAKKETSKITLHVAKIEIYSKKIEVKYHGNNTKIPTREIISDKKKGKLNIWLEHQLKCGERYNITVPFCGKYDKDYGVVIVPYVDDKKKENLLMTRSKPGADCLPFPYLGKVRAQSNYTVNILHRNDLSVASNMPLNRTHTHNMMDPYWTTTSMARKFRLKSGDEGMDEWTWDSFLDGGPFYPYQVAWVISKFKNQVKGRTNTHVNTWAQKDSLNKIDYAATVSPKLLAHFEDWFKVNTNLSKVDLFTIPDCKAKPVVNWGLITLSDKMLLYNDKHYSKLDQAKVCVMVAEVLSKLWFGNFITMPAAADKWLIDALTTYTSMLASDKVETTWKFGDLSIIAILTKVLRFDALPVACPIQQSRDDNDDKAIKLDLILQKKSLLILRMLHRFYGDKIFDNTLEMFLKENAHKCTTAEKFWDTFAKAAQGNVSCPQGVKIKEIVESWTKQSGYPVLHVKRHYGGLSVKVSQERFLHEGHMRRSSGKCWWIPLTLKSADGKLQMELISRKEAHKNIDYDVDGHDWLIANVDYIAPLRVNYDTKNWNLLIEALNDSSSMKQIPVMSRAQLVHDAFMFSIDGCLRYNITLRLASYLEHETEAVPLLVGLDQLEYINNKLISTESYGYFAKFVKKIVKPNYVRTGKLGDSRTENRQELQARAAIVKWACEVGVDDCEDSARTQFNNWMSSPGSNKISPAFRAVVYCTAIKHGGTKQWDFLFQQVQKAETGFERAAMLKGLACTREVWTVKRYIKWLMCKDSNLTACDISAALTGLALSPIGNCLAYELFIDRIEEISKKFTSSDSMHEIVEAFVTRFNSPSELDKFISWQKKNSDYVKKNQQLTQIIQFGKTWATWNKKYQQQVICIMRDLIHEPVINDTKFTEPEKAKEVSHAAEHDIIVEKVLK